MQMGNTERLTEDIRAERQGLPPRPTEELREREVSPHERFLELPVPIVAEVEETQVTRATWRLGKLKAAGVELHEILGGRAGAAFIRDYCGGDPEVAYAAIAFVYFPTTSKNVG
jgi:hypothetical protein